MTYAREQDIGKPKEQSYSINDIDTLIARMEANTMTLEEAVEELKKIRVGTGLILDGEIEEVD